MNLSLDQIQAFVVTVETGSFSGAGRRLGKAQSSISAAVANLEVDLDNTLFVRSGRYPVLTPEGERLYAEARLILERCEYFRGVAKNLGEGIEARLVLAVDELYPSEWLTDILDRFSKTFPTVELEVLFPLMEDISRLVLEQKVDLGITLSQDDILSALNFHTLRSIPFKVVCAPTHELTRGQVSWEDLKRYRQIVVASCHDNNEKIRFRMAADVWWIQTQSVAIDLLQRNLGWALLPKSAVASALNTGSLVAPALAFDNHDFLVPLDVIWHKDRPLGKATTWLKQAAITFSG